MQKTELLAPAKDLESGITAIDSGADAVYIGGPRFGARAAASNTIDDIEQLVRYAHPYHARVYVTLNTLLQDSELKTARDMVNRVWDAGADALIIQDMGLLELELPPIPLFASTQCHITTPEKAQFLEKAGLRRLILARELSLDEIASIRAATSVELETFVHGAICVCYSGHCYMSYGAGGRSGNRGECAQPCRMHYNLLDETGKLLAQDRYFLSLKDLNFTHGIGDLLDAGVTSFKIEGRLKDTAYIRNVVSHYRQILDAELAKRGLTRASSGQSHPGFTPEPAKSFNRGFTEYFLRGRADQPESPLTQKSIGEPLGKVRTVKLNYFILENAREIHIGDGICYFDDKGVLGGMFIEHVEEDRVYPRDIRFIKEGMTLYRNNDKDFEKDMSSSQPERKINVEITFEQEGEGFSLTARDEDGISASIHEPGPFEPAKKPEQAAENLRKQLGKTGGTIYSVTNVTVQWQNPIFLVVSLINEARRNLLEKLTQARLEAWPREKNKISPTNHPYGETILSYEGNVLNAKAREFYNRHGVTTIAPAAESGMDMHGHRVMTTRHCIRRMLGLCERYPQESLLQLSAQPQGRLFLEDGRNRYRLNFDCGRCEMEVWMEE